MTSPDSRTRRFAQRSAYASPWSLRVRLAMALWQSAWLLFARWTPKPAYPWRVLLLRLFGARVEGHPFVAASARIKMPWNLSLADRACIGPECELYNLAPVRLGARCTLAQQTYLCAGTHDFADPTLPLIVAPISIGADAFLGARVCVLPGVRIGNGAVVGACSVVTRDLPPRMICAGNPCHPLRPRPSS